MKLVHFSVDSECQRRWTTNDVHVPQETLHSRVHTMFQALRHIYAAHCRQFRLQSTACTDVLYLSQIYLVDWHWLTP